MDTEKTHLNKGRIPWNYRGATICPKCNGKKSSHGKLCRKCRTKGKPKCIECNKILSSYKGKSKTTGYCKKCWAKHTMVGRIVPRESVEKMRLTKIGIKQSPETIEKRLGHLKGKNHYNWKGGITNRNIHSLFDPRYVEWRNGVFKRDNYKCKINHNCKGQLQAHHILPWRDFIEERYNINNGITLCQAHHPRKRAEEKRLMPIFQELVSVSN